jgi:hypothetical protein
MRQVEIRDARQLNIDGLAQYMPRMRRPADASIEKRAAVPAIRRKRDAVMGTDGFQHMRRDMPQRGQHLVGRRVVYAVARRILAAHRLGEGEVRGKFHGFLAS